MEPAKSPGRSGQTSRTGTSQVSALAASLLALVVLLALALWPHRSSLARQDVQPRFETDEPEAQTR
jgi:hypothetical protein